MMQIRQRRQRTGPPRSAAGVSDHAILVVSDDARSRATVANTLRRQRHGVISAQGADEALRIAREQAKGIRVLLTDVMLPGTNGLEVAADIRRIIPELRVIYVSDHGDPIRINGSLDGASDFLCKPFSQGMLSDKIERLLRWAPPREPRVGSKPAHRSHAEVSQRPDRQRGRRQ